ncbi:hypothetical protein [Comamonas sp. B-9]|uniref:hypothetical protein n=1 Tax=Comamonas sp. B-9 TaxID=1055192 RepID=UPI000395AA44|nr:hypothetical protein [Comamonas sp. B-9]
MAAQRPLPLYTSRSTVRALKIKTVTYSREPLEGVPRGEAFITPADGRYAPFWVNEPWAMKNRPQPGGYFVVHADGHQSFSPANAFESGYSRLED